MGEGSAERFDSKKVCAIKTQNKNRTRAKYSSTANYRIARSAKRCHAVPAIKHVCSLCEPLLTSKNNLH